MPSKRLSILFYTLIHFSFFAIAQEVKKEIPLKQILLKISSQHKINFNYIEEEIASYTLFEPEETWSLEKKINYILETTHLQIKISGNNYYTLFDKKIDNFLCGYILDEITNQPIENVNLKIYNTNFTTFTNNKGYFELPSFQKTSTVFISHISYKRKEIKLEDLVVANCPIIKMSLETFELQEVQNIYYLTSGISKKRDGSIVINPKKSGLLPGLTEPDVFQTLQQIPGITSNDETISNVNIRGGSHDQTLFLWNGIRLFQTGHFYGLISSLNPNLAHTVKVIKNGSTAFFGDSTSGIVSISTHSKNIEKGSSAFGINMLNADFYTKIKTTEKSTLEISGRRSFTDVLNSPTYHKYYNRIFQNTEVTNLTTNENEPIKTKENFYFYDFTAQFHKKIGTKTNLFIDAIAVSNDLYLKQSKIENSKTVTRNSFLEQYTLGGNIQLITDWNKKNQTDISIYTSYYDVTSKNESIESNQIFNQENKVLDNGIRLSNKYRFNEQLEFTYGYQFNEIGIMNQDKINNPSFSRKIKNVLRDHSLIGELDYISKNEKLKTTFGLKNNYIEQFTTFIIEPRFRLNYCISNPFQIEILAESKHQTAIQIIDLQQDFLGIEKRRWVLSNNNDIPILKSKQISLGITFKKNNWLIVTDNFYKSLKGITSNSQGFQNDLEFLKINGKAIVYGSEILIQKEIHKITAWISYSYTNNIYTFKEFDPSKFPSNYEIKHNINTAIIYNHKNLKLAFGTKWHTGKPVTLPLSNTPVYPTPNNPKIVYKTPNSDNLENYSQLNLSGSYTFIMEKNHKLQVGASIQNLLNTQIVINQYYRINRNTESIEKVNTYSLERTPNAFVRFTF